MRDLDADDAPKRKSITVKSLDENVPSIVKNMMSLDDSPGDEEGAPDSARLTDKEPG